MNPDLKIYLDNDSKVKLVSKIPLNKLWLSQLEMAEFYGVHKTIINKFINKLFDNKELNKRGNIEKRRIENSTKPSRYYSFQIFTGIGLKIQSSNAVLMRRWVIENLQQNLGYETEYEDRVEEMQNVIKVFDRETKGKKFMGQERELMALIEDYTSTWSLFHKYDHQNLEITHYNKSIEYKINYQDAQVVIESLKNNLKQKFEATEIFSKEVDNKFQGIIGAVNQTYGSEDLYPSIEEKAANILYLIIKDHPFVDGNKRIASLLFIYFLERNSFSWKVSNERKINDNALVTLGLLVANSQPDEKELIVKLIIKLIQNDKIINSKT
jgi:prophage maintenance system killer protein